MGSKASVSPPPVTAPTSTPSEPPPPPAPSPPPLTPKPTDIDPPVVKETPEVVPLSAESTKPSFYSVVIAAKPELESKAALPSSAVRRWYKWSQWEQQKREQVQPKWYLNPPGTATDKPPVMATEKIDLDRTDLSNEISAPPSYQLRSTAIYSPPHGDRILPGRLPYSDDESWNFKYYHPDQRASANHSKAVMYQMNTRSRQTPVLNRSTSSIDPTSGSEVAPALPTFVSRGLQTDLEAPTTSNETRYFEKQPVQVVPLSDLSTFSSTGQGFYHLSSSNPPAAPVLPPIEKTPMWSEDQQPTSILKNPSSSIHEEVLKHQQEIGDGSYRVKKVHLLEKKTPAKVSFNLHAKPTTKASQSIAKSEQLFSGQLLKRKK